MASEDSQLRASRAPDGAHSADEEYRRWRDEQAGRMDADYQHWRRERFGRDFDQWRAIRRAQAGLRTGSGGPITHADRERELRGDDSRSQHADRSESESDRDAAGR